MTSPVRLDPAPGYTLPGVGVPGAPTEQEATKAAVDYGWLIAVVLVGVVVVSIVRVITKQINVKFLGVLAVVGWLAYQLGKGGS